MQQDYLLNLISDQSKDLIWVINLDFQLIYANRKYLSLMKKVTGVEIKLYESVLYKDFSEDYIKKWKTFYKRAISGEYFEIEEHYVLPESNETRYVQMTFEPLARKDKKIFAVACQSKDITRMVKQKSEMNQWINASLDVFCTINEQGNFVYESAVPANLWGYLPQELVGKAYQNLTLEESPKNIETIDAVLRNQEVKSFVNCYKNKDRDIIYNTWPAWLNNDIKLMKYVAKDNKYKIKKRKKVQQSEMRFKALVRESSDLIAIIDAEGNYIYVSLAITAILGFKLEDFLGKSAIEFIHPDDVGITLVFLQKIITQNQIVVDPYRFRNHKNEWIWIETVLINMLDNPAVKGIVATSKDVTEKIKQKKLNEIVAAEQSRFYKMFNEAPVSMCIVKSRQLVFEAANNSYYELTGRSKEIIGMTVGDVLSELEGQVYFDWLDKVYDTGETFWSDETPLQLDLNGDGNITEQFINFMFQPYRDETGNVEGILFFAVNVTNQVLARKKIEEINQSYVELMENMPLAIYTTDANGILKQFNKAIIELWGRTPDEEFDKRGGSLKIFDLAGNEIPYEFTTVAESLKTGKPLIAMERMVQRPNGEFRYYISNTGLLKDKNGKITGIINVALDTTEKRKAEKEIKKLSLIAQRTDNAVIITDPQGKIEWINAGFSKSTNFSDTEAIGKEPANLLHGKDTDQNTVDYICDRMKNHQAFECEILKYKKSGASFWVETKGQPIFDAKGKLLYYFQIESDITIRKEAFEKLVVAEDQVRKFARQLNNMLEVERARIAREIHDEFGQQLNGLKMSLTYLTKISLGNKKINDLADSMKEDIDSTIQSLRKFATELRPGILDTLGLTESLEWMIKEFAKKSNIQCVFSTNLITNKFNGELAINIFRICQEALTNALKHSGATKISIKFEQNMNGIFLSICDNGKGITSKNRNNPFSMGLLGMRERAKLINGDLQIYSKKGTIIHLIINNYENINS